MGRGEEPMNRVEGPTNIHMLGKIRIAGVLCTLGGVGWVANALLTFVISPPNNSGAFVITEVLWMIIQLVLLVGVVGLALSGVVSGWFGGIALGIALLGRVDFVLAEIHSLILGEESVLLPLGALITAVGMTLVGIAVLRARRWGGWQGFTPLIVGLYPFVVMFPFIFITDEPNVLAIAGWGLMWCLLGYAMWSSAVEESPSRER
jgi:hypothetical protein